MVTNGSIRANDSFIRVRCKITISAVQIICKCTINKQIVIVSCSYKFYGQNNLQHSKYPKPPVDYYRERSACLLHTPQVVFKNVIFFLKKNIKLI